MLTMNVRWVKLLSNYNTRVIIFLSEKNYYFVILSGQWQTLNPTKQYQHQCHNFDF